MLFFLPTTALSGGVKVIFELANRLAQRDFQVELVSYASHPVWCKLHCQLQTITDFREVPIDDFDFIFVSNAFLIPIVLPYLKKTKCIFLCQDYESYTNDEGMHYSDFIRDRATLSEIYSLPVPIITTSKAIKQLIHQKLDKSSYPITVGLDRTIFYPRDVTAKATPKRIMMVGNYLLPFKGFKDGFAALAMLAEKISLQLVLVTQQDKNRDMIHRLPYPVEVHNAPGDKDVAEIMASCHILVCASFYEGLGLPPLEAFCCGLPVVCTRNFGVLDYGIDGVNLLLVEPENPTDLADKIATVLSDNVLSRCLRQEGLQTMQSGYDWNESVQQFLSALAEINQSYSGPGQIELSAMQQLLDQLESEGCYTPITTFRFFNCIANEIRSLCETIRSSMAMRRQAIDRILEISHLLRKYLINPKAQYYQVFRSQYDLCQLILGFHNDPSFSDVLNKILDRKKNITDSPKCDIRKDYLEIDYPTG